MPASERTEGSRQTPVVRASLETAVGLIQEHRLCRTWRSWIKSETLHLWVALRCEHPGLQPSRGNCGGRSSTSPDVLVQLLHVSVAFPVKQGLHGLAHLDVTCPDCHAFLGTVALGSLRSESLQIPVNLNVTAIPEADQNRPPREGSSESCRPAQDSAGQNHVHSFISETRTAFLGVSLAACIHHEARYSVRDVQLAPAAAGSRAPANVWDFAHEKPGRVSLPPLPPRCCLA